MTFQPVRYYLQLRLRQAWRFFPYWDIHPVLGIAVTALLFGVGALVLLDRTPYAPWMLAALPAGIAASARSKGATEMLRLYLTPAQRWCYRICEGGLVAVPVLALLIWKAAWIPALTAVALVVATTLPERSVSVQVPVLPSPFPRPAAEWHSILRRLTTAFVLYALSLIPAVAADNGFFAIVGFLLALYAASAAYSELEAPALLCADRRTPAAFLKRKIGLALRCYALLLAPLVLGAALFFRDVLLFVPLLAAAGALQLLSCLFFKYMLYPNAFAVQLTQALFFVLLLGVALYPPLLLLQLLLCGYAFFRARRVVAVYLPC